MKPPWLCPIKAGCETLLQFPGSPLLCTLSSLWEKNSRCSLTCMKADFGSHAGVFEQLMSCYWSLAEDAFSHVKRRLCNKYRQELNFNQLYLFVANWKNYSRRISCWLASNAVCSAQSVGKVEPYYPGVLQDAQHKLDAACFQGHWGSQGTCWRRGILLTPVAWLLISLYFTGRNVKPLYYNISLNGES